ncbi:MAG: hypothetical protein JSS97_07250 [Actinobacteria bacterium]|nr:hypothetical protein [Actinomycetota bacterium]
MGRHRHRRTVLGLALLLAFVSLALGLHITRSGSAGGSTASASTAHSAVYHERIDPPTIAGLEAVYRRPSGSAYAAQALNRLAAPLAASCGHRSWVPELTGAAEGLSRGQPTGTGVRRLGITYGPYLGRRCAPPGHRNCETVGIDVVFRQAATRVVAVAGPQKIHLRTPGEHDGIRGRDWVGTFTRAGFPRPARGGGNVVHASLELRVRFADGRRLAALLRHVPLLPGWG